MTTLEKAAEMKADVTKAEQRLQNVETWVASAASDAERLSEQIGDAYGSGDLPRTETLVDELTRKLAILECRQGILSGSRKGLAHYRDALNAFSKANPMEVQ